MAKKAGGKAKAKKKAKKYAMKIKRKCRISVIESELRPKRNIVLTPNGKYVVVLDTGFTREILKLHRDCCVTLLAVACCPPKKPTSSQTIGGGGDIDMGCGQ